MIKIKSSQRWKIMDGNYASIIFFGIEYKKGDDYRQARNHYELGPCFLNFEIRLVIFGKDPLYFGM